MILLFVVLLSRSGVVWVVTRSWKVSTAMYRAAAGDDADFGRLRGGTFCFFVLLVAGGGTFTSALVCRPEMILTNAYLPRHCLASIFVFS